MDRCRPHYVVSPKSLCDTVVKRNCNDQCDYLPLPRPHGHWSFPHWAMMDIRREMKLYRHFPGHRFRIKNSSGQYRGSEVRFEYLKQIMSQNGAVVMSNSEFLKSSKNSANIQSFKLHAFHDIMKYMKNR